ncbi:MAG: hypothetical protein GXO23_01630 [Crenarchaeota archaeon]|nr:hypothetical protein [Thermoproteota archaeon]
MREVTDTELELRIDLDQAIEKFKNFFTSNDKYIDEINTIIIQRRRSICIDFPDLILYDKELADMLIEHPKEIIYAASEALRQIILEKDPEFAKSIKTFHARFRKLAESIPLRRLRSCYIGKLIMIEGIVTRETPPRHFLRKMVFKCDNCGFEVDVPQYYAVPTQPPRKCIRCGGTLKLVQEKCEYVDWQKIIVQEKPEELPPGQLPRSVEVILTDDLVDMVKPGDRVYVVGVLDINAFELKRTRPPVLSSYIEANYVEAQQKEFAEVEITPEDQRIIEELARDSKIRERIIRSIAPSIYGLEDVKEAIACLLFGGVSKVYPDGVRVRGDLHVLLIGDPGTGKSQLLRFVARIAPRAVYTTGKGSSAAGLCVGGDSVICTGAGIAPIKHVVDQALSNGKISLDENTNIARTPVQVPIIAPSSSLTRLEIHKAVQYYEIKTNRLLRIRTALGKEIELTPETEVLTYENGIIMWKKARDLRPGDYVVQVRKIPDLASQQDTECLKEELKQLYEVLGHVYARGHISEDGTLCYHARDMEDADNFARKVRSLFRVELSITYEEPQYIVHVSDKAVIDKIKQFLLSTSEDRHIMISPEITRAHRELIAAFLRGLFTSLGHVEHDCLLLRTHSKVLAYQIDMLLKHFGIISEIREVHNGDDSCMYEVRICDAESLKLFADYVGLDPHVQNMFLELMRRVRNDLYNDRLLKINEDLIATKVEDVVKLKVDNETVYDLTVNDSHAFVANGFIVHNTAAVVKDKLTGEFYLEAGALVLADMGVCIIDEIDKMDAKDRVAMHEALEQQTISIAKAGIVATLNARCAVLAAANPAFGRYLPNRTVAENVDLPVTLLSRFDLIFIIRDQPMIEQDKKVAEHVTTLHSGELPPEFRDIIPPDLLRKYIAYARKYVKPRWTKEAKDIIMQFYINLRAKSSDPNSPIAITARQLEALIRLAEAEAKMRLSPLVEREDAERAIMLFERFLKSVGIDVETGKIDIDIIMTGKPRSKQEKFAVLRDIIAKLEEANGGKPVRIDDVIKEAENAGLDRQTVEQLLNLMIKNGDLYMPKHGYIKRVSAG